MTNKGGNLRIRYDEGCLAAHALNLIGDRWALLAVRELMFAPKRFQMIRGGLPGITASVLTNRLTQLTDVGVITHDDRFGIYALTEAGHGLRPVLESLCRWALSVPGHDPSRFISPSALMISMGVNLVVDFARGQNLTAGFDCGREAFEMHLAEGTLNTTSVRSPDSHFVLHGTGNTLAAAVYGPVPLSALLSDGYVTATGDTEAAAWFTSLFRLAPQE
ncbi:MAG: winged helix-turn-helix transcriptional regulator [Halomonas sp.]|uniref:winged helix-turn-helix transcriptional regulator n=1 Tax=Halomonas sp. TaxID=1486246 RepID=UPI003F90EE42